jgi:hypothetical protein
MISDIYSCGFSGGFGFINHFEEITPFGIPQNFLQVTGTPTFDVTVKVTGSFKSLE